MNQPEALPQKHHLPTEDEIALCAYLIWEHEGRPQGREKEHWHQAMIQLAAMRLHENGSSK